MGAYCPKLRKVEKPFKRIGKQNGGDVMATITFDKSFVINDKESQERLFDFLSSDKPAIPLKIPTNTFEEVNRSEELLKQYLRHLKT